MITLTTSVTDGKINDLELFNEYLKYFEGKRVDISFEKHRDRRTNQQNRYLFGVVYPLIKSYSDSYGHEFTIDDWHEYYIAKKYFGVKEINGELIPKRSHEATTQEFNEAKDRIQRDWAEKGLVIPDPQQKDFL